MKILIYEDEGWRSLTPMSFIKCVFEIRCGFSSLLDRLLPILPTGDRGFWVRDYIKNLAKKRFNLPVNDESFFSDDLLIVNGRWLASGQDRIELQEERVVKSSDNIAYGLVKKETAARFWNGSLDSFLKQITENIPCEEKNLKCVNYPWDLINWNPSVLKQDFAA